jgi:exodeoxyribonuclease VIII
MRNAPAVTKEDLVKLGLEGRLNGFFRVSDEDYHSGPGVSSSGICDFLRSPAHYRASRQKAVKPTPAMEFGTQVHEFLLQPERFHARYLIEPPGIDGPRNKNPWKAKWDVFKAECEASGKIAVDRTTFTDIEGMTAAVCNHLAAGALLDGSVREVSAYVQCEETGFVRKARADIALHWGIADLKTTDDARKDSFIRSIRAFHYHVRAAWYLDIFNALLPEPMDAFVWVAVEKKPPYGVACYAASPAMLETGRAVYESALAVLKGCVAKDVWPCYSGAIEPIELPDYVYHNQKSEEVFA